MTSQLPKHPRRLAITVRRWLATLNPAGRRQPTRGASPQPGSRWRWAALGFAACALPACGTDAPSFFDDPTAPLPPRLSDLGIHPDRAAPDTLRSYAPLWPLWSGGSDKLRLAFVPGLIDTRSADAWRFPIGTTFVKTFAYPGQPASRPIETRVLRLLDAGWSYDVYLWADDGGDASLIALDESVEVEVIDADGARHVHRVPNRLDCRTCHESAVQPVLGFAEIQLDDATLTALDADGLRSETSTAPARIDHPDPATRAILGGFQADCVHCHHGGAGASASFDLRHPVALSNTLDQPTASSASAAGIRIVPGDPEASILFLAFSGETDDPDVKPMPPLGAERRDADAIARLRAWIEALPVAD